MDRRSWPWKKKSSDKKVSPPDPDVPVTATLPAAEPQEDQDNSKKVKYVQISVETYAHMTELEDEVKALNDQIKSLNEDVNMMSEELASANTEMISKDAHVKQHAKVAEDAVSGWEKAETEAKALKLQLESVTLLKLTAEDQALHLDGALKECMRQIRNLKEEHERKLHETILSKTKQWDRIKLEFEAKINSLDQQLLQSSAENAALSRSLQERSNMLMKISEERSEAEAEIELLKNNIESCEREIHSLKYELHMINKELDIRNEEKNMSMKSAEVANKQHLEGVKKITKLEAECQRLRGLVRKKLPGPAAMAQMKLEVENLGRDYGETRSRRSPGQSPIQRISSPPEFSLENVQLCNKETEFLTSRLLATEEETKMLKEALANRNTELQASRNMFAKATSKIRSLEAQFQAQNQQKSYPKSNFEFSLGSSSHNASNPPSLTSMSEDGNEEDVSCVESWATRCISEISPLKKENNIGKARKVENVNNMELMDFLEMERLANEEPPTLADVPKGADLQSEQQDLDLVTLSSSNEEFVMKKVQSDMKEQLLNLQSRISRTVESEVKDTDIQKILEDIKRVVMDRQASLPQQSVSCSFEDLLSTDIGEKITGGNILTNDGRSGTHVAHIIDEELSTAISEIQNFVVSLGKEVKTIQNRSTNGQMLSKKVEEFSDFVNKVSCRKACLTDFVLDLSHVFSKASELSINFLVYKGNEGEPNSSDCIDKVTLLEKKVVQDDSTRERCLNGCSQISRSTSDPEALQEGSLSFDLKVGPCSCSFEVLEQLKSEKDSMERDLARSSEDLASTKFQLEELEKQLMDLKSQLACTHKSNSLAETQLKCMAEAYKSLEMRAEEFETEVNLLREKVETLDLELQVEKNNHQVSLSKCKDLEDQLQRNESRLICPVPSIVEEDSKLKQERELAEKLAECQETIFLLGKQLKSFRPSSEHTGSPGHEGQMTHVEDEVSVNNMSPHISSESQDFDSADIARVGGESPSDAFNSSFSPSDTETNFILRSPISSRHSKHRPSKSSLSSFSAPAPEKNSRGFSRFFSSKSKNEQ
ncbi:hypothetical protein GIB67_007533 [Kingdonia uniflora]|uniref:Filament-like plant protein 4 n=1 Tax=Kingdonia uniflora TaxID=39325 RepID=A0A7J7LNE2_9MAGN|nr:hypothetical protein GIB67_007533 [Kingdonia uniflora]